MGRIKLETTVKKKTISILIDEDIVVTLEQLNVKNKSHLINWLLKEHFNLLNILK